MKKLKLALYFVFVFISLSAQEKKQLQILTFDFVAKKELKIISDNLASPYSDPSYFIVLGGKGYVGNVKIVGVRHTTSSQDYGVGIDNKEHNTLSRYDKFWELYFRQTGKNPWDIKIAPEGLIVGTNKIGRTYLIDRPSNFVTPFLFNIGVRNVFTFETRNQSAEYRDEWGSLMMIFFNLGGKLKFNGKYNSLGIPIVIIEKEPKFGFKEINLLKNVWYPKHRVVNEIFEDALISSVSETVIPVVGLKHALSLYTKRKIDCIAITSTVNDLLSVLIWVAVENYYLKIIKK